MSLIIKTFPMMEKTLYYVKCSVCKRDRILDSIANVSQVVSEETFRKLSGCTCQVQKDNPKVKDVSEVKDESKVKVVKKTTKRLTAVVDGVEMTVKEIADRYQLSTSTVRQRIHAGKSGAELIAPAKRQSTGN